MDCLRGPTQARKKKQKFCERREESYDVHHERASCQCKKRKKKKKNVNALRSIKAGKCVPCVLD
jgi:hypothetical protein